MINQAYAETGDERERIAQKIICADIDIGNDFINVGICVRRILCSNR